MRRRTLLLSLLLLALLLSGWGGVLAAAFCAHDAGQPAAMAKNHECCRARLEQEHEHCGAGSSMPSSHEAMAMDEMEATPSVAEQPTGALVSLGQPMAACLHCVSRSGLPTVFPITREPEQKRRDSNIATPSASAFRPSAAASFAPTLLARQKAPPGATTRRRLLLNIFVI